MKHLVIVATAIVLALVLPGAQAECEDQPCGRCCCESGGFDSITNSFGEIIHGRDPMMRNGNIRGSQCLDDAADFSEPDSIAFHRGEEVPAGEYQCYRFENKVREAAYMENGKLEVVVKPCFGKPLLLASVYECPTLNNSKTVWKFGKNYNRKATETVQEWERRIDNGDAKEDWEWKGDEQKLVIPITHKTFYISVLGDGGMGARYSIAARAYDLGKGQPATIDAVDLRDNTVDYTGGNETRNEWRDTNGTAVCTDDNPDDCLSGSSVKVFWTPADGLLPGGNQSRYSCMNETNSIECLKPPPDCCSPTLPNDGDGVYPYYCKPGLRLEDGERWSKPLNGTTCRELLDGSDEEECGMLNEFLNVTSAMSMPPWRLRPVAKDASLHNMWTMCGIASFGTPVPKGNSSEDWGEPIDGYLNRADLLANTGKTFSFSDWHSIDELEIDSAGHLGIKVDGFQEKECNTTGRCWTNINNNTYIVNVLVRDTQTGYISPYKFTTVQVKAPVYVPPKEDNGIIIGVSVGAAVLVIAFIVAAVLAARAGKKKKRIKLKERDVNEVKLRW